MAVGQNLVDLEVEVGKRRPQHRDDFFDVGSEVSAGGFLMVDCIDSDRPIRVVQITGVPHPLERLQRDCLELLLGHRASIRIRFYPLELYSKTMGPSKSRQQIAAEETQRVIVEAAADLFFERGFHATSIAQIAAAADVAIQTVYNSVGSKKELLSRVLDHAAGGDRAPTPVATFMQQQAEAQADPTRIIELLVTFWKGALARTAPVFRVIREAAATDPDAAALEHARASQRLANYLTAAHLLHDRGALREKLTVDQAAATIFAVGHPEIYRSLVLDGSWSEQQWTDWVRTTLNSALLSPR